MTTAKLKVRVFHSHYGCDTGCCGHTVEVEDKGQHFEFGDAPYKSSPEEKKVWARELAEKVIKEKWPECLGSIDWDSMDVSDVSED